MAEPLVREDCGPLRQFKFRIARPAASDMQLVRTRSADANSAKFCSLDTAYAAVQRGRCFSCEEEHFAGFVRIGWEYLMEGGRFRGL